MMHVRPAWRYRAALLTEIAANTSSAEINDSLIDQAVQGRLGRLLQIEANFSHDRFLSLDPSNWRLSPAQAPAAGMTATGIHLTDLAVKLMGKAVDVRVVCESLASALPQGDTLSAHTLRDRRLGDADDAVLRPLCGVWDPRLDRYPRQGACRETARLGRHLRSDRNGYRGAGSWACGAGAGQSERIRGRGAGRSRISHYWPRYNQ